MGILLKLRHALSYFRLWAPALHGHCDVLDEILLLTSGKHRTFEGSRVSSQVGGCLLHNILSELLGLVIRVGVDTVFGENSHGEEVHARVDESRDVMKGVFSVVQDLSALFIYSYACKVLLGAGWVDSRPDDSN